MPHVILNYPAARHSGAGGAGGAGARLQSRQSSVVVDSPRHLFTRGIGCCARDRSPPPAACSPPRYQPNSPVSHRSWASGTSRSRPPMAAACRRGSRCTSRALTRWWDRWSAWSAACGRSPKCSSRATRCGSRCRRSGSRATATFSSAACSPMARSPAQS